jgi:hypothetical protein
MLAFCRRRVLLGFALAAVAVGAACEKVPLLAPTGSTIVLTATTTAVSANGTTPIVAQVLEAAGTPPHEGTQVTFTTTLGSVNPAEALTDANGQVTTMFVAGGQNGTATIGALSGGATTGSTGALKIFVGTAAVGRVALNANPSAVPAGGSSTVTALVLDINGNALVGSPVQFTTTAGNLSSAVAVTDSGGSASTVLTTNVQATVTATVGAQAPSTTTPPSTTPPTTPSPTGQSFNTVIVNVLNPPTITVAVPTAVQKGVPATFTFTVTAATSNPSPPKNVLVEWGDGQTQSLGATLGAIPATHTYTSTGSFVLKATVTDTAGATSSISTPISVTAVPGVSVVVEASVPSAPVGTTITFTVTITPPAGVSIVASSIDFGDTQVDQLGAATSITRKHFYLSPGTKTVVVTVLDTTGRTTVGSTSVLITP